MNAVLRPRVIPCLQLIGDGLVKTVKFRAPAYIGDPINTVRIFNELEVDELCFQDIRATIEGRQPNLKVLADLASESFMPMSYGGGVRNLEIAKQVMRIGFEKVVVNSMACEDPAIVTRLSEHFGSQAVVGSIDVKRGLLGRYQVSSHDGRRKFNKDVVAWAVRLQELGAGELLVTSMDRDGTWTGFDVEMIRRVAHAVDIPVIASGGAGSLAHIKAVVTEGGAAAVALGSMVVYQARGMGVLVNFPDQAQLAALFAEPAFRPTL